MPSPTGGASFKDEEEGREEEHGPGLRLRLLPPRARRSGQCAVSPAVARGDDNGRGRGNPRPAQTANQCYWPRPTDLRSPPRIWKLVDGAGQIAGIGSPLISPFSPLVLGDASFKGEPDPGTPFHSSCCPPSFFSHGLSLQTVQAPSVRCLPVGPTELHFSKNPPCPLIIFDILILNI